MPTFLNTRLRRTMLAWLAAILLVAAAVPAGAAGPPGNNGTVKIHSGGGEPSPEIKNEPHVSCPFHAHFFFADTHQAGQWRILAHPPGATDEGTEWADYDTGDGTSFVTDEIFLGAGHYKLYWQGRNDKNVKHKTFWVEGECGGEGGGGEPGGGGDDGGIG